MTQEDDRYSTSFQDEETISDPRTYLEAALGVPFTEGNRIAVLKNGDEIFPAMLAAIKDARQSIIFETYVYWKGRIAEKFANALAEKAREGLLVRVLLDYHGSMQMDPKLIDTMMDAGAKVRHFRPLKRRFWDFDKRTHRKVLVCDQSVGFTGGVGIATEWEGDARNADEWRETHFRFEGRAVQGLSGSFWNNWIEIEGEFLPQGILGHPVKPRGDSLVQVVRSSPATHQSEMELVFEALLMLSQKRITLTTPYFTIRKKTIELLKRKIRAGVQVEILIPGAKIDQAVSLFVANECICPLLESGATVRRFQPSMLHAKIIRIDDDIACVGSPNFNQRSRKKDFEVAALIIDREIARLLDQQYDEDIQRSDELKPEDVKHPNLLRRALRSILMVFKEQL